MTQWTFFCDRSKTAPLTDGDDTFLRHLFELEQNQLTDNYIKLNQTIMQLSIQQQNKLIQPVNMKTWYLLFFLYSKQPSSSSKVSKVPLIV